MTRLLPLLVPLAAVLVASALSDRRAAARAWIPAVAGAVQLALVAAALFLPEASRILAIGAVAKTILLLVAAVFFAASLALPGDIRRRDAAGDGRLRRWPASGAALFLLTATAACLAGGLSHAWAALAGAALALALCMGANDDGGRASKEYLFFAAIGLVAAGAGLFLISRSSPTAGFVLAAVGLGSLMFLQPLAVWLPGAVAASPGSVSALLCGGLPPLAFLLLLRARAAMAASGNGAYAGEVMAALGAIALAAAGLVFVFSKNRHGFLAASCSLHMGLAMRAAAEAGTSGGALWHVLAIAPLLAALALFGGLDSAEGAGPPRTATAIARICALFGCFCFPPFGAFSSLTAMLGGFVASGRVWPVAGLFAVLAIGFYRCFGLTSASPRRAAAVPEIGDEDGDAPVASYWPIVPPVLLLFASISLGVSAPEWLEPALAEILACFTFGIKP